MRISELLLRVHRLSQWPPLCCRQTKDVWCAATASGQASLEPKDFYVAVRAVALAQSGESTLTRKRLRETATDIIPMATFKGCPKPTIEKSQGKKPPSRAPQHNPSKKKGNSGKESAPAAGKARPGSIKKAKGAYAGDKTKKEDTGDKGKTVKKAESLAREANGKGADKKGTQRVESAKQKQRRAHTSRSSSASSGEASDSSIADSSRATSGTNSDEGGRISSGGSAGGGSGDKGSGSGSDSEDSAINGASRGTYDASARTASVAAGGEGGRHAYAVRGREKKSTSEGPSSSSPRSSSSSSGSGLGSNAKDDPFVLTDKARVRYQVL